MNPRSIAGRLLHGIAHGWVKLVDDSGSVQTMQVSEGAQPPSGAPALLDDVPVVLAFGFTSSPPVGSNAILARLFGSRTNSVVLGHNHKPSRPTGLQPGDTALYDVRGAILKLTAEGLLIDAAGLPVKIQNAPTVTIIAAEKVRLETPIVECTGDFVSRADGEAVSLNALHDAYDAHKHTGVTAGASLSGPTDHPA